MSNEMSRKATLIEKNVFATYQYKRARIRVRRFDRPCAVRIRRHSDVWSRPGKWLKFYIIKNNNKKFEHLKHVLNKSENNLSGDKEFCNA